MSLAADRTPGKVIVVCLDGTNDQIGQGRPTNVGKVYEMLKLTEPRKQIAYYDPGIGTLPSESARGSAERSASRVAELALGWGIKGKLASAYTWLMEHYEFGDDIYVFGFSRGAYTARALVGMLNRPGLLRSGSENLVQYAVREYAMNKNKFSPERLEGIGKFADAFCWGTQVTPLSDPWPGVANHQDWHAVPIRYLGIWDTVEATGLPRFGDLKWPGTHTLHNVRRLRHAVSIDEWRMPYHEFLVTNPNVNPLLDDGTPNTTADIQEAWFAGVHCDVGGTYPESDLASTALKWVLDGVVDDLTLREKDAYDAVKSVHPPRSFDGELHRHPWPWRLALTRHRDIRDGSWIHHSVQQRLGSSALEYQPKNLPASVVWLTPTDHVDPTSEFR